MRKKMKEFIFTWSIENISYSWHKDLEPITSPSFMADTLQNTVWTMRLYSRVLSRFGSINSEEFLDLFLFREEDHGPRFFPFDCEFSCVSANNLILKSVRPRTFTLIQGLACTSYFLRRHEVFVRKKALYLQQDILTLRCRMWNSEGDIDSFGQCFGRTTLEVERILSVHDMKPRITREKTILIQSKKQNKLLLSVNIFHEKDRLEVDIEWRNAVKMKLSTFEFSASGRNRKRLTYRDSWLQMPIELMWIIPFSNVESKASVKNKLKITCEFIFSTGEQTNSIEKISPCSFKFPEFPSNCILSCIPSGKLFDCPSVCNDLWNLYSKRILCDVELKTKSKSFWVHKTVLCARSPVFLAMFSEDMKEKISKCVEIEDLEDDILKKFLAFLYTDKFEDSQSDAIVKLYYASDKYQVERLKCFCCSYFMSNINGSNQLNVYELLVLADKHSDTHLKSKVEDYIVTHHEWMFRSTKWKEFIKSRPLLAAETMLCAYTKLEKEKHVEEHKLSSHPNAMDDFRSLYQSRAVSDIAIQTTSGTFPAHKTVLCAGSSRLRRIMAIRTSTHPLKIEDLEDETVSRLLLFLYTDSLGDITWEDATKLYKAAVAYKIERLKITCSCFLVNNLDGTNAANLLELAHQHRDVRLASLVEDFISLEDKEATLSQVTSNTGETDPPKRMETRLSKRLRLESDS